MLRHSVLLAIAIGCTAGCVSSSHGTTQELPEPVSLPPVSPEPARATSTSHTTWRISPVAESKKYSSVLTTRIQQTGNIGKQDSLAVTTLYSLSIARTADVTSLSGKIEAFTVRAGEQIGSPVLELQLPVSFTGKFEDQEVQLEPVVSPNHASSLTCDDFSLALLATVHRNVFIPPLEISGGQIWQDSTSYTMCSGPIPLSVVSVRNYRLTGEITFDGVTAFIVDENERTFSRGEGSQGQHRVRVETHSTTTKRLYLDRTSGALLSLSADSKTILSIQTSGRMQNFIETSKENTNRQD